MGFLGNDVTVLEMDGKFDNLQELIYVESHLSNTATKFYGELTQQMIKMGDSGLGQRHGLLPDARVAQDPRVLREALGRRGRGCGAGQGRGVDDALCLPPV